MDAAGLMSERTTNHDLSQELGSLNVRVSILEQSVQGLTASQEETRGQISTLNLNVGSALVSIGRLEEKVDGVQKGIIQATDGIKAAAAASSKITWWILGIAASTFVAILAGLIVPGLSRG
jgi:chromosome segregation ATPase